MTGSRLLTQGAAEVILLFVTMNSPDPFCASTTLLSLLAALLCSGFSTVAAVPGDEHWDNQFGPVGVNDVAQSITVQETVTVTAETDPVFTSSHTGAATTVMRDQIALLPTLSGRIGDVTRLTPQAGAGGTCSSRRMLPDSICRSCWQCRSAPARIGVQHSGRARCHSASHRIRA